MDYGKKYKELVGKIKKAYLYVQTDSTKSTLEEILPELKESEDEKIRKAIMEFFELQDNNTTYSFIPKKDILTWLEKQGKKDKIIKELSEYKVKYIQETLEKYVNSMNNKDDERLRKTTIAFLKEFADKGYENAIECIDWLEKQGTSYTKKDVDDAYLKGISDAKNEIDKQYEATYQIRKDIATFIFNYRGVLKDRAKWMDYLGIKVYLVKEQDEKNPQPSLILKSALEAAKEEKVDNQNCVKPDKNEPEFHEGEWVVYNHDICQIVKREEGCNKLVTVFGIEKELVNERNLSTAHLWTIQDAKDGDVLACNGEILLFKSYSVQDRISLHCWYNGQTNNFHNKEVVDVLLTTRNKVCPATKEQRDLLFQKMAEAGYEWNASKKELKKIEITDLVEDYISQKPVNWSEEDEQHINSLLKRLDGLCRNEFERTRFAISEDRDWLKSLKDKGQPRSHWKPSEEQIIELHRVISGCSYDIEPLVQLETKLKEL